MRPTKNRARLRPVGGGTIGSVAFPVAAAFAALAAMLAMAAAETAAAAASAAETATLAAFKRPGRAFLFRACLVDGDIAAFHGVAMELFDGLLGVLACRHGDEGETARAAGEFVEDQVNGGNAAGLREQVLKVLGGGGKRDVPHVELCVHLLDSPALFLPVPDYRVSNHH